MMKPTSINNIIRLISIAGLCGLQAFATARSGPRGARNTVSTASGPRNYEDGDLTYRRSLKEVKKAKAPSKRECTIVEETEDVEFKCKAKTNDDGSEIKDEIKFKVSSKGDKSLNVKVEYKQKIEDDAGETETKTKFDVAFDRIIEYRKADDAADSTDDTSMAYDWDSDTIVQTLNLENWSEFTSVVNNDNLSSFSISTPDDVVTFKFTIARADEGNITANKMKIDFDLALFPWSANDTYVALICSVESERKIKVEELEENGQVKKAPKGSRIARDVTIDFEDAVDTIGFTPFGEYNWLDVAEATPANTTNGTMAEEDDTEEVSVIATSPADEDSNEIAFSFVGEAAKSADDIYWDPEAGIGYGDGTGSGSSKMGMFATLVGLIVVALL